LFDVGGHGASLCPGAPLELRDGICKRLHIRTPKTLVLLYFPNSLKESFEDCQHGLPITKLWLRNLRAVDYHSDNLRVVRMAYHEFHMMSTTLGERRWGSVNDYGF
jgi:hypothetical protein